MLDDFLTRAALAGTGTALACAGPGCFVVWRRLAYFGDATSHAAVLGVALALALEVNITLGVVVVALTMALAVGAASGRSHSADTLLGALSHGALAVGLVAVALTRDTTLSLESYLFGDILAVSRADLAVIWSGVVLVTGLMAWRWNALLTTTLSPDLAASAGLDPRREQLVLSVALALVVALAITVVGALLITAMLILPAAAARSLARSPEAMVVLTAALGVAAALGGLALAYAADTPAGPTIVCFAAALFLLSTLRSVRKT